MSKPAYTQKQKGLRVCCSIFSLLLFGGGLYTIINPWYSMTTLNCQRLENNQGKCVLLKGLSATLIKEIPLNSLLKAQSTQDFFSTGKGGNFRYWVILETTTGKIDLPSYENSGDVANLTNKLNTFINNPSQKSLQVTQSDRISGFLWGSGCLFGAFLFGLIAIIPPDLNSQ